MVYKIPRDSLNFHELRQRILITAFLWTIYVVSVVSEQILILYEKYKKKHAKAPNHAIYSSPHRVEKLKLKKKILRIISNNYPFSYICKVL